MRKPVLLSIILLFIFQHGFSQSCSNWLFNSSVGSTVSVGDLDITGNTITVEALINRTTPYLPGGGDNTEGDIVSKHNSFNDINYLLRPNHAYITTNIGFYGTPDICPMKLNKTYHVAMVYNGSTLKFYRDGALMSQVNATGTLVLNQWRTRIGWYDPASFTTQFIGYINEVRIWNVARTQAQIKANMTTSLPNPTSQPGLLAYYTFDNLLNKQGNSAYNGVLTGAAAINRTNPNCTLIRDSCNIALSADTPVVINKYTPVISFSSCKNIITVEDATAFNTGDTVMIMQMKGATIDSAQSASFGNVTSYNNAGNYEMNIVKGKTGNDLELKNKVLRQYDLPNGKVQLIRVPYYQDYVTTDTLTCLPWNGKTGGVLVLNAENTITLNKDINISGKGFRGGRSINSNSVTLTCGENSYYLSSSSIRGADKGESIYELGTARAFGKGPNASGGGGGIGHNSGGGGGGNGGNGGLGGYQLEACTGGIFDNRGLGGNVLIYNTSLNKVFMGGGGGSGHTDNPNGNDMNGGNGGGIAIIITNSLVSNGGKIIADGATVINCDNAVNNCHDASGGGGAGGTILIKSNSFTNALNAKAAGGKGGDLVLFNPSGGAGRIGPGGGGAGGTVWLSNSTLPTGVTTTLTAGANGTILQDANNAWGTTPGSAGVQVFNLQIPVATVPFKPNIDSVRIQSQLASCRSFNFAGIAYLSSGNIQNWQWNFGDNSSASTQNALHVFAASGTYNVKLVVTDNAGCKDSATIQVTAVASSPDFTYKQDVCNPLSVQFFNTNGSGTNPGWSFGDGSFANGNNPVQVYPSAGVYNVTFKSTTNGCTDSITKSINIGIINDNIILTGDTTLCPGATKQLLTVPALDFCWTPTTSLDDPLSPSPTTSTTVPITYYFTAEIPGNNLITNGTFSLGNTGFTSGYSFASINTTEGEYFVGTNPRSWNGGLSTCGDHSSGSGNMLMVNGSPAPNVVIWKQTIPVTPNTNYAFATWIQALFATNPAQLAFTINGEQLGNPITASLPTCTWTRFSTNWNAGSNTTATIAIINKNTLVQGNDFALDDISFSPLLIKRDSVRILIDQPRVIASADTAACSGSTIQLTARGSASYAWTPGAGLSSTTIANPIATITANIQFVVTGTSAAGCTAKDTVNVSVKPAPIITTINDTSICIGASVPLTANGGNSYSWSPATGLTNANSSNPVATPSTTIRYIVTGTGPNGCSGKDTVNIRVNPLPTVSTINDSTVCIGSSVQLSTSGALQYSWLPANGLSNAAISNPVATPTANTQYIVKGTDANGCTASDTVNISTRALPNVNAGRDSAICAGATLQLNATGAAAYSWSPAAGLSSVNLANPIATITSAIQYIVKGTDAFGCSATDSVTIASVPAPIITTINDTSICIGASVALTANGGNSYSWSPATGLTNANSSNPVATVSNNSSFIVTGTGSNGCTGKDTVSILINPLPPVRSIPDTAICNGSSVQLTTSGAVNYSWQPTPTLNNSSSNNPVATPAINTRYIVIGTDANGCSASDTVSVSIRALPTVNAGRDSSICAGSSLQLNATGASSYSWSPVTGLSAANSANPVSTPTTFIRYFVNGTDAFGCSARDSVDIGINSLPTVALSRDTVICKGLTIQLVAGGGALYQWTPATGLSNATIANPLATIANNTRYSVAVTDNNGCTATKSVSVSLRPAANFTVSPNRNTCEQTQVQLLAMGGNQYQWSPALAVSNSSIPNPFTTIDSTTTFNVIIKDNVCSETDTLQTTVTVFPKPVIRASKSNDVDCASLSANLLATGADTYFWTPSTTLSGEATANPLATPATTTTYTVTGTNQTTTCISKDTITVFVSTLASAPLFIPNAFTPNKTDNLNNCWRVSYNGRFTEFALTVYNRYGEIVFATNNPAACWDGTFKGRPAVAGSYVYIIKAKNLCRDQFQKGNLLLIR